MNGREKNRIQIITLLFTVLLSLTGKTKTLAQQTPSQPPTVRLDEFFGFIEEERQIVTGVSRPIEKKKLPASITVINADELKLLGLRHLTDIVNYIVPGAVGDIHRSTRTGLYAFRGITVDNNGKYVFMVDGLNVGDLTNWGAFNERYLGLLDELDRVEIIQGPGSVLYGSGAVSGIINFITKTGKTFQGTEATGGYGWQDKVETSVKFGEQKSENEDSFYYLGFKRSNGSTPKNGDGGLIKATRYEHSMPGRRWDNFDTSGKFHANIRRGDFTLRMRFVRDRFEEPFRSNYSPVVVNTSDVYWLQNYLFVQPEFTHKISQDSTIKANVSFVMNESGFEKIEDWYKSGVLQVEAGERERTTGERKLRAQVLHYYDGWKNHKLTTGFELFWMHTGPDFKSRNYIMTKTSAPEYKPYRNRYVTPENIYSGALFGEDVWQLTDKTTLFAGAWLEDHNKTKPSLSPRIAVSHDVTKQTNWKLLYSRGFRTPDWVYYDSNKSGGYSEPRPERVDSFEGHLTHQFTPKFKLSTIAYYTIYKDLINYYRGHGYYNYPKARAAGLETLAEYRKENLILKGSYSFSRPVHIGNDNFNVVQLSYNRRDWAQMPTHMTKLQAIYHLIKDKCIIGATYWHHWGIRGQRNADSNLKRGADYLNATLTLKIDKNCELQTSVYNVTGEDHPWWGASTSDGVSRDIDPHTEYFLRLIWKF